METNLHSSQSSNEDRIRQIEYQDAIYFSIIDSLSVLLKTNRKCAQNYYHVLKKRLKDNNSPLPHIVKLKAQASDMKFYLTDFTNHEGIELLRSYVENNIKLRKIRVQIRQEDEVENFHPKVLAFLKNQGWKTHHHVRLASGHTIDIVGIMNDCTYVIECKPKLTKGKLFAALGQVLCYQQEYNPFATPMIAAYSSHITEYEIKACRSLNVELILI